MTRSKKWYAIALTGLSVWIAGFVSVPLIAPSLPSLADFIYGIFGRTCHQMPERSFFLNDLPMGVCARCTGIYFSGWFVLFIFLVKRKIRLFPLSLYLSLSVPLILDFCLEKMNFYQDLVIIRIITGILFGIALFHMFAISLLVDNAYQMQKKGFGWTTKEL